jgi:hypothetical protein
VTKKSNGLRIGSLSLKGAEADLNTNLLSMPAGEIEHEQGCHNVLARCRGVVDKLVPLAYKAKKKIDKNARQRIKILI